MMYEKFDPSDRMRAIQNCVDRSIEIVGQIGQDYSEVFPDPSQKDRREDVVWGLEITPEQEEAFRGVVSELGIGRSHDLSPAELGVDDGYTAIMEGGQPHKLIAQLDVVLDENQPVPGAIFMTADTGRELAESEQELAKKYLGFGAGDTLPKDEYELALSTVLRHEGFLPDSSGAITNDHGSYTMLYLGSIGEIPVHLMGLKREYNYPDEPKRFDRLNNQQKMETIAQSSDAKETVFVTSGSYQPSNEIQAIAATEKINKPVLVASYGTESMASVKGEDNPGPTELNQLGGEMFKVAKLLEQHS